MISSRQSFPWTRWTCLTCLAVVGVWRLFSSSAGCVILKRGTSEEAKTALRMVLATSCFQRARHTLFDLVILLGKFRDLAEAISCTTCKRAMIA